MHAPLEAMLFDISSICVVFHPMNNPVKFGVIGPLVYELSIFLSLLATCWQCISHGPQREKTCLLGFGNNTGPDQPAHPHSLISAFVIRFLESIISRLATSEISNF